MAGRNERFVIYDITDGLEFIRLQGSMINNTENHADLILTSPERHTHPCSRQKFDLPEILADYIVIMPA